MRNIKDVLRLKLDARLSHQQIAASLGISKGVVTKYVGLAAAAGLDWQSVLAFDEAALERRLLVAPERPRDHVQPDYGRLHQELRRNGMTLMLLWEEHRADHADRNTYGYTQFCENYRRFARQLKRSMRQLNRAGEKLFIDYAGPSPWPAAGGPTSSSPRLGASSYTYACATPSETMANWLELTARALRFYGGVPQLIVPDNPRAMIADANRYEPRGNDTVLDFAATTAPRSCRRGPTIRRIRPRRNRRCRSASAGSWRAYAISNPAACTRSTRPWRRCWPGSTTSRSRTCPAAAPAPSPGLTCQPCRRCRCRPTRWPTSKP